MNLIPLEAHMEFVTLTILVPRLIVNYNGSGSNFQKLIGSFGRKILGREWSWMCRNTYVNLKGVMFNMCGIFLLYIYL
jgi:hypothetical protein